MTVWSHVEASADEFIDADMVREVMLVFQNSKVLAVNDNELSIGIGNDVITIACFGMGFIGFPDSITINEVVEKLTDAKELKE